MKMGTWNVKGTWAGNLKQLIREILKKIQGRHPSYTGDETT